VHQIDSTGSADRKSDSGWPRTTCVDINVKVVEEMAMSQENVPESHRTVRQIARETGISKSSAHRIIHSDLKFKCFKKERAQDLTETNKNKRLVLAKRLIRRYPEHSVSFIWFTDEKQNAGLYRATALATKQPGSQSS